MIFVTVAVSVCVCFFSIFILSQKMYAEKKIENKNRMSIIQETEEDKMFLKAQNIISSLSEKAQAHISISEKEEFIADLKSILEFNNQSSVSDLPLLKLVDKKHFLEKDYVPANLIALKPNAHFNINRNDLSLRKEAYDGLLLLSEAALNDGIKLLVSSTYRSYEYQEKLFARWVLIDGLEEAERESARAGTSQHQLGTAVDFGSITDDFAETKMGKWIYEHASDYGWSLSFPEGYEDVTGYRFECWHFRYIGKDACSFQKKYFSNVQQFMLEFLDAWYLDMKITDKINRLN